MKSRLTPKANATTKTKPTRQTQTARSAERGGKTIRHYSDEEKKSITEKALIHIAEGKSLASFCDKAKINYVVVWRWLRAEESELNSPLACAREDGTHALIDKALRELDDATAENYQVVKTRVDGYLRLAGKWNPKAYGDKQTLDVNHAMPDFSAMPAELRAEIRRYLQSPETRSLPSPQVTIVQDSEG